jgi:SAM-dependent methyltransferase
MTWTDIAAATWDDSGGDEPQWDHDYFRQLLKENPGPALDVGCGAGRLLVRFLSYGLDVDGIDTSADMLRYCREKAEVNGMTPNLYQQSMITMDLPRHYHTIFVPCGSFALVLDRHEAIETLRRFHAHLEPGGLLAMTLLDIFGPDKDIPIGALNKMWEMRNLSKFPEGAIVEVYFRADVIDRIEQVYRGVRHYRLVQHGEFVREQILEDTFRWYTPSEIRWLLTMSGFEVLTIKGNDTIEDVNESHDAMMVVARKKETANG